MNCLRLPSKDFLPQVRVPSTWLENYAFGYDLIHFLRPKTVVELGVFWGGSFFVFCQAVKAAGVASTVYAVDTWEGDSQAGKLEEETYQSFQKHREAHFSDISKVMRMRFEEALPSFPDGSIDLLHIDGFHTYEAVREDYEKWSPKVSASGIILFHDVKVVDEEQKFGVKRFWDEIKQGKRYFEMENEFGLGILFQGERLPEGNEFLQALFQGTETDRQDLNLYYLLIKERLIGRELIPHHYKSRERIQFLESRLSELETKIRKKEWNQKAQ
jgi:predicted O-methyltransferase YrrM